MASLPFSDDVGSTLPNNSSHVTSTSLNTTSMTTASPSGGEGWITTVVCVGSAIGAAVILVAIILIVYFVILHRRRQKMRQKSNAFKTAVAANGHHTTPGGTQFVDRQLTGTSMQSARKINFRLGNAEADLPRDTYVWHTVHQASSSSLSSSSATALSPATTSASTQSGPSDVVAVIIADADENRLRYTGGTSDMNSIENNEESSRHIATLHRSPPHQALESIFTGNDDIVAFASFRTSSHRYKRFQPTPRCSSSLPAGVGNKSYGSDNCGFVGDCESGNSADVGRENYNLNTIAVDDEDCKVHESFSRLSWRARLQAGIADSSSAFAQNGGLSPNDATGNERRGSYLDEVISSVRFFSGSSGSTGIESGKFSSINAALSPGDEPTVAERLPPEAALTPYAASKAPSSIQDSRWLAGGEWCLRDNYVIRTASTPSSIYRRQHPVITGLSGSDNDPEKLPSRHRSDIRGDRRPPAAGEQATYYTYGSTMFGGPTGRFEF